MASLLFIALASLQGVHAWGALGHQTVGFIAQHYVKDTTATWAKAILSNSSDTYLASVATWADSYRSTAAGKFSAPFHYIDAEDNPPSTCNVDFERDCGNLGCSVSAIANYTQRVADVHSSAASKEEALKFLVHFLGDITQPLHDEAIAVGGNNIKVTFNNSTTPNLHSIWDTQMPEKLIGGYSLAYAKTWANSLASQIDTGVYSSQSDSWIQDDDIDDSITTAVSWASDANQFVCSKVMPDGTAALQQGDLYPKYYNSVIDTIELQIAKAGYRLANWLDMLADSCSDRKRESLSQRRERESLNRRSLDVKVGEAGSMSDGRQFLPAERELSRAKLARMAVGWDCDHEH